MEQTLGKRIVSHRKALGLTQDQLAERLGVTAQAVSKWENDQSCPDITTLPKLARIFGTTTDALLGIEPEPAHAAELVTPEEDNEPEGIHFNTGNWDFHWDGGRKSRLGLALLVLLVGGLLLAGRMLQWDVSFWGLLWPCALLVFGLGGLYPRFGFFRLGCALFGGYALADEIGVLPDWLGGKMIFPILLLVFGLSLLAEALRRPGKPRFRFRHHGKDRFSSSCRLGEDSFTCAIDFGSDSRYIDLPRLSRGDIACSFGELTVDLSGCGEVSSDCGVEADCSFGTVTILIPRRFRAELDSNTAFGGVEVTGHPDPGAAPIAMECNVSFGTVELRYI